MTKHMKLWPVLIAPALIVLFDNLLDVFDFWGAVWRGIVWLAGIVSVSVVIPIWGIILLVLAVPILISAALAIAIGRNKDNHPIYTSDDFFEITWHWTYSEGSVTDLTPRCPKCRMLMVYISVGASGRGVVLQCDHCGYAKSFGFGDGTLIDRVRREIDRKLVTGEHRNDRERESIERR